jgi:hypothetical protein
MFNVCQIEPYFNKKYRLTYQVKMIYIYLLLENNYLCYSALLFIVCF